MKQDAADFSTLTENFRLNMFSLRIIEPSEKS